ncbi:tRNA (adenosine(37)-N6)-threonylcarbamoyltransferase complex dimerization subunit type 1 TsaB [Halodesulfovibrio marinisediminis]|uniref:tRNA threonylcarbamoyl adenosine modification protein YeaZ n=1 Tax=Halodesulfovibrio marinisediminis DSM 17456 TaxID=1121457 RepID=A0A1N6HGD6_9BACT|nr:tRNA (adenosine(37)-N6)-threonylcarbamoyltransferase complex dimerization subunit type 1 TsaB [Halodesulfovibrio marinisediminis]SIO18822.1 tRNA threonylcarbamoyl adenosine modification protein YeaZ [Halodesulfovibrio marinisediminis DSM 17456]
MSADSKNTLIFNSAEARLQIICGEQGQLLFSKELFSPRQGMQVLLPALMDGLEKMSLSLNDIGRIACVRGPGSFTGLRLVLATALGLARTHGFPMAGIDYLPALAMDTCTITDKEVWVITHARRGQVHYQAFQGFSSNGLPKALMGPTAGTIEDLATAINTRNTDTVLLGTGVQKNREFFEDNIQNAVILDERFSHPKPEVLLDIAATLEYGDTPVAPLYLRPCDAEENLDYIVSMKGVDPDEARQKLAELTTSLPET